MHAELKLTGSIEEIQDVLNNVNQTTATVQSIRHIDEMIADSIKPALTEETQINNEMAANDAEPQPMPAGNAAGEAQLMAHLQALATIDKDTPFSPTDRKMIQDMLAVTGVEFNKRNATHTLAKELLAAKGISTPATVAATSYQQSMPGHDIPQEVVNQFTAPQNQIPQTQTAPAQIPAQTQQPSLQNQIPQTQPVQQQAGPASYDQVKEVLKAAVIK